MKKWMYLALAGILLCSGANPVLSGGSPLTEDERREAEKELLLSVGWRPRSPAVMGLPVFPKGKYFWQFKTVKTVRGKELRYGFRYEVTGMMAENILDYYRQQLSKTGWEHVGGRRRKSTLGEDVPEFGMKQSGSDFYFRKNPKSQAEEALVVRAYAYFPLPETGKDKWTLVRLHLFTPLSPESKKKLREVKNPQKPIKPER
ncbi:MAG: hypothetical protein KY468_01245 [Armatimonadetes bacterium]|nr:hypothetical protein [Armatimonadota bacterium]